MMKIIHTSPGNRFSKIWGVLDRDSYTEQGDQENVFHLLARENRNDMVCTKSNQSYPLKH